MGIHSYDLQICAVIQEKHSLSIRLDHNLFKPYLQKVRDRIRNIQRLNRMDEHSPVRRRDVCLTDPAADGTAIMIESLGLLKRNGKSGKVDGIIKCKSAVAKGRDRFGGFIARRRSG